MAKQNGLGMALAVDDSGGVARTISNDVTNLTFATPRAVQEITGLDKSAHERLLLLADFTVQLSGVYNPTADMSHSVFKTVPSTSVNRTVTITMVGGAVLAGELFFTDYSHNRGADGSTTWQAPGQLQSGTTPTWA